MIKGNGLHTVRRVSPTQQVREQLLTAIREGEFAPGTLLPSERVLCETFGVSRVSVREAIAGLEAMGLIRVQQGRGAFVRESMPVEQANAFRRYLSMHRDELLELLKVRGALDELAADEACRAGLPDGVQRMLAAANAFRAAADATEHDYAGMAELDVAFHLSIAQAAGGDLLPRLLGELNSILDDSRRLMLSRKGQLQRSIKQHQAIADAILAGDARAARRAANQHLSGIRDLLTEPVAGPSR